MQGLLEFRVLAWPCPRIYSLKGEVVFHAVGSERLYFRPIGCSQVVAPPSTTSPLRLLNAFLKDHQLRKRAAARRGSVISWPARCPGRIRRSSGAVTPVSRCLEAAYGRGQFTERRNSRQGRITFRLSDCNREPDTSVRLTGTVVSGTCTPWGRGGYSWQRSPPTEVLPRAVAVAWRI